jgi:glycosyltransferase involved in cell wall biosynthesis
MERTAAGWTDYLVTINQEDYTAARSFRGISQDRVRLIPGIGVDTSRFESDATAPASVEAMRSELGLHRSAFVVTMVAEFAPVKRHSHVLQALAQVTNPDVVLVLVGTGPLESAVRDEVARHGLKERVRFAGYRRDIPVVLAASDALLLASEREGLARSVLEGMAAGLPIVGTRTRGIADAVGEDAGWLAEKDDASALAAAIDSAASDRVESRHRGEIGRERARREFALPHIVSAYEDLYLEALASRL